MKRAILLLALLGLLAGCANRSQEQYQGAPGNNSGIENGSDWGHGYPTATNY